MHNEFNCKTFGSTGHYTKSLLICMVKAKVMILHMRERSREKINKHTVHQDCIRILHTCVTYTRPCGPCDKLYVNLLRNVSCRTLSRPTIGMNVNKKQMFPVRDKNEDRTFFFLKHPNICSRYLSRTPLSRPHSPGPDLPGEETH